ncbi:MAG: hypothetical protein M3M88_04055 [Thermoproteota archaeon]|nr:hypothetical protein [Thermoproteota archaeon]
MDFRTRTAETVCIPRLMQIIKTTITSRNGLFESCLPLVLASHFMCAVSWEITESLMGNRFWYWYARWLNLECNHVTVFQMLNKVKLYLNSTEPLYLPCSNTLGPPNYVDSYS